MSVVFLSKILFLLVPKKHMYICTLSNKSSVLLCVCVCMCVCVNCSLLLWESNNFLVLENGSVQENIFICGERRR